ncbi:MAG: trypsin-like peptidase domain-containing protein [Candidatus Dormiibacterota bacterium]
MSSRWFGSRTSLALILAFGLVALGSLGVSLAVLATRPATPESTPSAGGTSSAASSLEAQMVKVVVAVRPSVVEISTGTGLGSGVIYDQGGDIVTNAHVVGSSTTFTVLLSDGKRLSAVLVGAYTPDDLAVIKVDSPQALTPARFGNSDKLQAGDFVLAIGSPLGLSSSVTEGIVSFNGRTVSEGDGVALPGLIQTSAPINPGNSGGALVNLAGEVVGIPTLAAAGATSGSTASGIGFAISSKTVQLIAPQLIATGTVTKSNRAALGISAASAVGSSGAPIGVAVVAVTPGGPADSAGIVVGDLITAVADKATPDLTTLAAVLAGLKPGDRVKVSLTSADGTSRTVSVTLGQLQGS